MFWSEVGDADKIYFLASDYLLLVHKPCATG